MFETSTIEISQNALKNNRAFLERHCGGSTVISSVVKGNAYGHGIEQFVPLAEKCGWDHFSVFSADEALRVHAVKSPSTAIMIMGSMMGDALAWAVEHSIEFYVFELYRLKEALQTAQRIGKPALIHLELETGMNRTGLTPGEIPAAASLLIENAACVDVKGICTHYAGAETYSNFPRIREQINAYKSGIHQLKGLGVDPSYHHSCCSAASIRFPDQMGDMVRIGIMQYGYWPSEETWAEYAQANELKKSPLKRLISWKSRLMSVKAIPSGEYIGYGSSFLAQKDTVVGLAAVGYSHGFSRSLSNTGRALVRGVRVPVIGMVNMNCLALDLSDCPSTEIGDEVVLIGYQGDQEISVASFSEFSNQLNYELLTRLPLNIPRQTT